MGPFRPSRERRDSDPYLDWKMAIFALGAAFGLAGIFFENRLVVGIGIGILVIGLALRLLTPRRG